MADRRGGGVALVALAAVAVWVVTAHSGAVEDAVARAEQVAQSLRPSATQPAGEPGEVANRPDDVVDVAATRALSLSQ